MRVQSFIPFLRKGDFPFRTQPVNEKKVDRVDVTSFYSSFSKRKAHLKKSYVQRNTHLLAGKYIKTEKSLPPPQFYENIGDSEKMIVDYTTKNPQTASDNLKSNLIDGLDLIPTSWTLTPVDGNKRPYRKAWNTEPALNRTEIIKDIKAGKAKGYGLRTGEISGGILAVDCDGNSAWDKLIEILEGEIPDTICFSSGKDGRAQFLFKVPENYWQGKPNRKVIDTAPGEMLELRWNSCQSVLPPSVHPETGEYKWEADPVGTDLMEIPEPLLNAWEAASQPKAKVNKNSQSEPTPKTESGDRTSSNNFNSESIVDFWEREILPRLTPELVYGRAENFRLEAGGIWRGVCPIHPGADNDTSFCVNNDNLTFCCHSCGEKGNALDFWGLMNNRGTRLRGKDFVEGVRHYAGLLNMDFPDYETEKKRRPSEFDVDEPADLGTPESYNPDAEITQQILNFLYGDKPWICVNDRLFYWTGTHYKESPIEVETRRIRDTCNAYMKRSKDGKITYPYAKPSYVKTCLEWVKMSLLIDPNLCNPAGLNCTNGVLQITWNGNKPSWKLVDHTPTFYYLYEPKVTYNPNADPTNCLRLLQVLELPEQEIFLKTISASLDLANVRKSVKHRIRALLCKGDGNNGKDALRNLVSLLYGGYGLTGKSLADFAAYDQGRKFPLAGLRYSRVNWSSENASATRLDSIQCLKAFVTGDTLQAEAKGKDEQDFDPVAIAIFNINDVPNLSGALEAIQSRYAVLSFNKTFKQNADPSKGELEVDPRFKYDPEFVCNEVLPAFLNLILDALVKLMAEGIDYECTNKAMEDIQCQNSHLFQFCRDVGLTYVSDSTMTIGEVWEKLRAWYIANGTLTIEETATGKEKFAWIDQARRGDINVKGSNQVLPRFLQLFPKAKRVSLPNNRVGIAGIGIIRHFNEPISQSISQSISQLPLQDKGYEPVKPVSLPDDKKISTVDVISPDLPQQEQEITKNEEQVEELPKLANNPDTVRATGLSLANDLPNEVANEPNKVVSVPADSEATDDLKVGDRVMIDLSNSKFQTPRHGQVATIIKPDHTKGYWLVQFSDGVRMPFSARELKLVD